MCCSTAIVAADDCCCILQIYEVYKRRQRVFVIGVVASWFDVSRIGRRTRLRRQSAPSFTSTASLDSYTRVASFTPFAPVSDTRARAVGQIAVAESTV